MLETGGELNLATEAFDVDTSGEIRQQHLHHHFAAERSVLGDEHPRHAAATQLTAEDVSRAEGCLELVAEVGHQSNVRAWRDLGN